MKNLDLEPHEWRTAPREGEPFFGPGWPGALAYLIGMAITVSAIYFAIH